MAGYSSVKNKFHDNDEDIDDDEFLRGSQRGSGYFMDDCNESNRFGNQPVSLEEKRQDLLQKIRESEQRSISSQERSLSYLRNSEEFGNITAEQLFKQREQLERTEQRLDDINTTLRFSQRHIQGIKSLFGGLKNLISGKPGNLPTNFSKIPVEPTSTTNHVLDHIQHVDRNDSEKKIAERSPEHPSLKIRGLYDTDENIIMESKAQDIIDKNLDHMLSSIHRLKDLSYNLGDEIVSQNELIEKVIDKTEKAGSSLQKQTKEMRKLTK